MATPTTVTANFRTLFTISDLLHEVKMSTSTLRIQLSGNTRLVQLPCTKPVSLEFNGVEVGSKLEFDLEDANGNIYGYSEVAIPDSAFKNRETSINQPTHFYLNNSDKEFINAKIFIIMLNTEIAQRPKFKNAVPRTPTKTHSSATKSPNKSSSTPQKKGETSSQKRLRTEERMSSNTSHQDIRDFDDSVDQGDTNNVQKTLHSQASIDNFLPSSLVQLSTPKDRDEQSTFTSKIDQGSISSISTKDMPRKILINSQPNLDKQRQSEPFIPSFRDKQSFSGSKKDDRISTQGDGEACDGATSSSIPTESEAYVDHHQFQTFCPRPAKHGLVTPERKPDRGDLEDDSRLTSSAKKRRPPSYSPISERNTPARTSYSEVAGYKAQIEQLQTSLHAKESQITIVNMLKQENEELKRALKKSEEARKTLQTVSSETTKELKHTNLDLKNQIAGVLAEKKDYLNRNTQLQNRVDELEKNAGRAEVNLGIIETRNGELCVQVKELKNAKDHMEKTQRALETFEKQRAEERTSYMNALAACQKGLEEAMAKVEKLTKEKKEISEDFQKTQIALIQEKNISQGLRDELFLVQKSLQNAESYKLVVNSLENEKKELIKLLLERKKGQTELQTLLENVKTDFAEKLKENEKREEKYISQINTFKENTKNYEAKIGILTNEVSELRLRVSELLNEGSALEQLVCLNEDIEQQLESANKKLTQVTEERDKLSEQLLTFCQAQEVASSRLLKSEKNAQEIRESLNERDEYIANLKKLVTELRESQNKYTPQRDDPIDMALARYLNSSGDIEKLKFLFFRESCGVYQFGTKRVFIKLEGDNIIIRVGGGYSTIEEFLDQHFQHEYEKFLKTAKSISNRHGRRSSGSVERNKVQAC